jgi:hypothetical protein
MDYNLKYLKYKNKYINLKNMIGNGPDKLTPEQKTAYKALEQHNRTELLKKGISKNFVQKFLDKIMIKELDIDYLFILFDKQLDKIKPYELRCTIIYNILINYKSDKKFNQKFDEKLKFLIEMNNSNDYDFNLFNENYAKMYFELPDKIYQIFEQIAKLYIKEKKCIIIEILSELESIIRICPYLVSYLEDIIDKKDKKD